MFNPWNAPVYGNVGEQNSRFPYVQPWTPQHFAQTNWFNPAVAMPPGPNFNMGPVDPMASMFMGGFPGFVPQSQPPPPPPPANPAPHEPPKTNPPPPPSYGQQPSTVNNANTKPMDFEKEWQKYQESLHVGQNQQQQQMSNKLVMDNPQVKEIVAEEESFNQQFTDWKKEYDSWKKDNMNHPNKEQFYQYEQQWRLYENQMLDKGKEIQQRKEQTMRTIQSQLSQSSVHSAPAPFQSTNAMRGQAPAPFAGWNEQKPQNQAPMPPRNQAPVPPQNQTPLPPQNKAPVPPALTQPRPMWNQPGGKGDQVNFGQDNYQRFQAPGQQQQQQNRPPMQMQHQPLQPNQQYPHQMHQQYPQHHQQYHQPNAPLMDQQRAAWQRHSRPLLDIPGEHPGNSGPVPRPMGGRFPQIQGPPRIHGNIRYKPPEPTPPLRQPFSRPPVGNNRPQLGPQEGQVAEQGSKDVKKDSQVPNAPRLSMPPTRPTMPSSHPSMPRPLLADPNVAHERTQEEAPSRFGNARRPPQLGEEFEPDRKRIKMDAPFPPQQHQPPQQRFSSPVRQQSGPRHFAFSSMAHQNTSNSDMRPRLQMMGPQFRRHGAAAVSIDHHGRNHQNREPTQSPQKVPPPKSREAQMTGPKTNKEAAKSYSQFENSAKKSSADLAVETSKENRESNESDKQASPPTIASDNNTQKDDPLVIRDSNMVTNTSPTIIRKPSDKPEKMSPETPNKELNKKVVVVTNTTPGTHPEPFSRPSGWNAIPENKFNQNIPHHPDDRQPRFFGSGDSDLRVDHHFYGDRYQGMDSRGQHCNHPPPPQHQESQWEADQDWRDGNWNHNWSRDPVVHDYNHHGAPFRDDKPRMEDKDERYPPGMFHVGNNPYAATVIDYGHGGREQDQALVDSRAYPPMHPSREENFFKHDQDFRTPPFGNRNPDWLPSQMRGGEFGPPHSGLRIPPRIEEPIIEKIPIETLLLPPGRTLRPDHLAIMIRGLPGAGKTHIGKLIKEREIKEGGSVPRLLSLDDYFVTEVEKVVEDSETGKKIKKMVMEYEFDITLEPSYKASFLKSFKKHVDDLYFNFIIVDATFDKKIYMDEFWSYAKNKGFQVYVIEVEADVSTCAKRNDHLRTLSDIQKIKDGWDETPRHYLQLDAQLLLQGNIEEVEMDNSTVILEAEVAVETKDSEEVDNANEPKSKWEMETSEHHLDKLDGLKVVKKVMTMEEYLQVPEDYEERSSESGKKRVRWADIEERKGLDRMRELGFVVGFTDWKKLNDDSCVEKALTKTKYI